MPAPKRITRRSPRSIGSPSRCTRSTRGRRGSSSSCRPHEREALEDAWDKERCAGRERVPLLLLADGAKVHDVRPLGDRHLTVADEDERGLLRGAVLPARPPLEELAAAFALDDAADVEEERAGERVALAEAHRLADERIDADADDLAGDALVVEAAMHHTPLLLRVVGDRARRVEHGPVDAEPDGGLVVCGRHEDGALGHEREPHERWPVDVGEEEDALEVATVREEVIAQVRRDRALRVDERELVRERVPRRERAMLAEPEVARATSFDGKASHGKAVDPSESGGVRVLPGPVVARGRRGDLDRDVRRETVHQRARVRLGAPGDVAVALHHDQEARAVAHWRATRSTSSSSRRSNAPSVHSRSTHARPRAPSSRAVARSVSSAVSRVANSSSVVYVSPPPARRTCPAVTGFTAATSTGVPTCQASSSTMPRLSRREGRTSASAAASAPSFSSSDTRPSARTSSRTGTSMRTVPQRTSVAAGTPGRSRKAAHAAKSSSQAFPSLTCPR